MFFRKGLIVLFFLSLTHAAEINYSGRDIFPLHEEMEPAVRFWISIYAQYNSNQYVLHDARAMDVIYEVLTIGTLDETAADDPLSKDENDYIKERSKFYKDILNAIAAAWPDSTTLDAQQKKVRRVLSAFNKKDDFIKAAGRIRAQKGQRNKFKRGLEISGRYLPFLKKIFKEYNLPEELTVLPHVESSFNYQAYSSAGAAGIWQFTRGTGKQFLKISYEIDERLDPVMATEAAARLLTINYKTLGHWPLAITAYNHGLNGMKNAVKKLATNNINTIIQQYNSRYFKFASRNFYCEFIAALHVVQNYTDYFGPIIFDAPVEYKEYTLPRYLKYETLAGYLAMEEQLFRTYNPALRSSIYDNSKYIPAGYRLRLPSNLAADSLLAALPQTAFQTAQKVSEYYHIRYGDTLSDIARRFGTTVELLLALNNISDEHYIRRGMTIRIPGKSQSAPVISEPPPLAGVEKELNPAQQEHMAKQTLEPIITFPYWQQVTPEKDSSAAFVKDTIEPEIEFIQNQVPAAAYIRVEPEETLGHYAEWLQVKTQRIRDWNNFSFQTAIQFNQKIKLIFETVSAEEFNRLRLEYHRGIEEDFFMHYEITGTVSHEIKSGENIWYLCNFVYNLPYWLIVDYNEFVKIDALKTGDKLVIPSIISRG